MQDHIFQIFLLSTNKSPLIMQIMDYDVTH